MLRLQVPKTKKPFRLHPLSGAARFNLTFRRLKPEWERQAPLCRCGRRAVMRVRMPRQPEKQNQQQQQQQQEGGGAAAGPAARQLRYFYSCDTTQGPPCKFWAECRHTVQL